jgi:transposase InsO family protein
MGAVGTHYGDVRTCLRTVFAWLARYNTRRRHSPNGHLSPDEYEHRHGGGEDPLTM